MRKKISWEWERLDECTARAKVIGGWVLKCNEGKSISTVFILDRDHEWFLLPQKEEKESIKREKVPY